MKKSTIFLATTGLLLAAVGSFAKKKTAHQYTVATKGFFGHSCNLVGISNSVTRVIQVNRATLGGRTLYTAVACAYGLWTIVDQ